MEHQVNRIVGVFAASIVASSAIAADMPSRYSNALSPQADALANEMAYFRGVVNACRTSDGTILNQAYWSPRFAIVPESQRALFAATVKSRSIPTLQAMSGPDSALRCDDAIDAISSRYESIDDAGPGATPVCFDDPVGDYACSGVGEYDPLAGVNAILEGY